MASTQIADVVVPRVFTPYVQLLTAQKSAFVQSGVIEMNDLFDSLLAGGGRTFDLPFYNDLADTEANVSGDALPDIQAASFENGTPLDADREDAVPEEITTGQEIAIRHNRNQSWQSADLASALAGSDPQEAIAGRVSDYWVRQQQTYLIQSTVGVMESNIADEDDMVIDLTAGAVATPDDSNLFGGEAFLDTINTMGDFQDDLVAIAIHSTVFNRMQKLNLIDFIPDSDGRTQIAFYQGRRVIVDDGLPAVANGVNTDFSSYVYGPGAFAQGVGSPRVGTEVSREALAGNGGGSEILTSRVEWLLHPRGWQWLATPGSGQVGQSPTNAEMATAANWDRVFERKLVRIAELRTNG